MKDTPNLKIRPIKHRKCPIWQLRRYAGLSRTELYDLIRQNINNTLWQHRWCSSLSKAETRDLIGLKINKGNSCVSVSQKLKQTHAVKCGSPQQKPKPFKKCIKLHKTEVSHTNIPPIRPHIFRHNFKSPGHGIPRDHTQPRPSRPLNPSKVRQPSKTNDLRVDKNHKALKRAALSGNNMSENSDEEREKLKDQHKCLRTVSKSSSRWPVNRGHIDPVAFSNQIKLTFAALKKRPSNLPLKPEEVQKHLNAIGATASKRGTSKRQKKNSSKVLPSADQECHESVAPEDQEPEGTTNHGTRKTRRKRKRSEVRIKSEPDSESSEPQKSKKRLKRSTVSDTEVSTDSDEYENIIFLPKMPQISKSCPE